MESYPVFFQHLCSYHNQTITYMAPMYNLDVTNLVGPLHEIAEFAHQILILDLLPYPFLHKALLVTFINIINIFSHAHVFVGLDTNTNTNTDLSTTIFTISDLLHTKNPTTFTSM